MCVLCYPLAQLELEKHFLNHGCGILSDNAVVYSGRVFGQVTHKINIEKKRYVKFSQVLSPNTNIVGGITIRQV